MNPRFEGSCKKLQVTLGLILLGLVILPDLGGCDLRNLLSGSTQEDKNDRVEFRNFKIDPEKTPTEPLGNYSHFADPISVTSQSATGLTEAGNGAELEQKSGGLFKTIGDIFKKVIEPKQYFELIFRYHKWFTNYKAFEKITKSNIPSAIDVLKLEYAREEAAVLAEDAEKLEHDHHFMEGIEYLKPVEEVKEDKGKILEKEEEPEVKAQSMDFIFRVLKRLIGRLETNLQRLEYREGVELDVEIDPKLIEMDEEAVRRSIEGVKKSVIKSVTSLVTDEAIGVARIATFNGLALYMESKVDVGDALDHLRPIIMLLGTATTPLFFSYLSSLRMRVAYSLMKQVASSAKSD